MPPTTSFHAVFIRESKGALGTCPLSVQFLSISVFGTIWCAPLPLELVLFCLGIPGSAIGFLVLNLTEQLIGVAASPPRGNPGSANDLI